MYPDTFRTSWEQTRAKPYRPPAFAPASQEKEGLDAGGLLKAYKNYDQINGLLGNGPSGESPMMGGDSALYANPWAWLALAIIGNESYASQHDHARSDDKGTYAKDMLTGHVLSRDIEHRYNPKLDKWTNGAWSNLGLGGDSQFGADLASFHLKDAWDGISDTSLGKAFSYIKGLFD